MADHPASNGVTGSALTAPATRDHNTLSEQCSNDSNDYRRSTVSKGNHSTLDAPFSNVPLDTDDHLVHHNLKSQTLTQDDLRQRPPLKLLSGDTEPYPSSSIFRSCASSKWIVLLLFIIPLVVVTTAALLVFGILPLITKTSGVSEHPPDAKSEAQPSHSLGFDAGDDASVRLLSGVIVGCVIIILLLVGAFLACFYHRKATRGGIDDGLLDGIPVRDGVVTLTKLHNKRGEYRIDLSSGELNTTLDVDEGDYIASVRESARRAQEQQNTDDHQFGPVTTRRVVGKLGDDLDTGTTEDNRLSLVRNSSYKRAVEGKSIYEFQNRPQSVLFDVNKYISEKGTDQKSSSVKTTPSNRASSTGEKSSSSVSSSSQSGSLSSPPSVSHSSTQSPKSLEATSKSPRHNSNGRDSSHEEVFSSDVEASPSSNLVNAKAPTSYGTLGRSRLLSSVDDDGYHFDNLGYSLNQPDKPSDSSSSDPDSPFESFPDDREQLYQDSGVDESTEEALDHSILDAVDRLEKDLQKSPNFGNCLDLDGSSSSPNTPSAVTSKDGHVLLRTKSSSSVKVLSKQDSFQGLPNQPSFDKYLSLVRLDSTTSLLSPVEEEPPERVPSLTTLEEAASEGEISAGQETKQVLPADIAAQQEATAESKRRGIVFDDTNR